MGRFDKYPEYKSTKFPWIGDVPISWEVRRLKEVGRFFGGAGFPHEFQNVQGEDLYFYKVGDLSLSENGKTLLGSPHSISKDTAKALRATVIPKDAIVYAKIGAALLLNRRRMTTAECCIDNNMTAYITAPDKVTPEWAFYWLSTIDFGEHVNPGAVPSFSEGYQSVLPIPVPPIDEQQAIARFLDSKTAQIDALIAKKQTLLDKLAEKRTALISHAVTKGLDPSVPMKDSGLDWLGEIPSHWTAKKLKYLGKTRYGLGEPPQKLDGGLPFIRATDIYRGEIDGSKVQTVDPDFVPWSRNPALKAKDILVVRSGAYTGDSAIVPESWAGSIAGYDMVFTADAALPEYLAYNLLSKHVLNGQIYLAKNRAAQPHLNAEELGGIVVALPSEEEQTAIVAYLDGCMRHVAEQIEIVNSVIDRLHEYRVSLITNAVTGKIDVRGFKAPQSAEGMAS